MHSTVDHSHAHICDWCNDGIKPGETYYTDGRTDLCSICVVHTGEGEHEVPRRVSR
jgi:hypothetical protein